jgi:hypothetical protein
MHFWAPSPFSEGISPDPFLQAKTNAPSEEEKRLPAMTMIYPFHIIGVQEMG